MLSVFVLAAASALKLEQADPSQLGTEVLTQEDLDVGKCKWKYYLSGKRCSHGTKIPNGPYKGKWVCSRYECHK